MNTADNRRTGASSPGSAITGTSAQSKSTRAAAASLAADSVPCIPDVIASDGDTPGRILASTGPEVTAELPHVVEGRIGTHLVNVSWRFRVRWLGDG